MHEHFFHLLLSILFFIATGWLLVDGKYCWGYAKIGLVVLTFSLITFLAFPIHYLHASHFEIQKYDCCLPVLVAVPTFFEVLIPLQTIKSRYQIIVSNEISLFIFSLNNRSPPIV